MDVGNLVKFIKSNEKGAVEGIYYALSSSGEIDDVEDLTSNLKKLIPALK